MRRSDTTRVAEVSLGLNEPLLNQWCDLVDQHLGLLTKFGFKPTPSYDTAFDDQPKHPLTHVVELRNHSHAL